MNALLKRYEFQMADACVVSQFDIERYANLPVRKWPFIEEAIASGDMIKIYGHLRNAIRACEERQYVMHALGGLRLLSRMTNGRLVDNDRIKALAERFSAISLTGGYELCLDDRATGDVSTDQGAVHPDIYFEYDRRANAQAAIQNASFSLKYKSRTALTASASVSAASGVVGHSGTPVIPAVMETNQGGLANALAEAVPLLQILFGANDVFITEIDRDKLALYRNFVRKRAHFSAEVYAYPYVDLSQSEQSIRCDIRKSSRSLINWGDKNLRTIDVSGDALTPAMAETIYAALCKYHVEQIAKQGYDYMPRSSFDYTMELCRSKRGEASLAADLNGAIVGASVVIFENDAVAYYKEGAYNHDVQGKSPAYFLLFHCIMRAKLRGLKIFLPNRPLQAPISYSGNHKTLWEPWRFGNSDFKDGFSSTVGTEIAYRHDRTDRVNALLG